MNGETDPAHECGTSRQNRFTDTYSEPEYEKNTATQYGKSQPVWKQALSERSFVCKTKATHPRKLKTGDYIERVK